MLFVVAKQPTEERSNIPTCSVYWLIRCALASTGCMPANTAHLKQSFPVPLILTTALRVCIQLGSGTNALALNGSRCHNDSCKETKFEKAQPEPFTSYTSMKFNS